MASLLIVDDIYENRYLLESLLKGYGHVVTSASNGAEALEIARKEPPDMIVTDILMPVMDGFELCRIWKKDPDLSTIPFIFYTATYTEDQDRDFALGLGADRFIIKPSEPEKLIGIINEFLEKDLEKGTEPQSPELSDEDSDRQYGKIVSKKLEQKFQALLEEVERRKKIEIRLRESESRFRLASLATSDVIFELDREKETMLWFGGIEQVLGIESESIPDTLTRFLSLVLPQDRDSFRNRFDHEPEEGETQDAEFRIRHGDGSERIWKLRMVPVFMDTGFFGRWIGACVDMTETRALEAELKQARKMEAIGHLAGGVAHDFNNLLQVILGFTDMVLWDDDLKGEHRENLEQIHNAAERATVMTRQLLAFSRKQEIEPQPVDLNLLVKNISKILKRLIRANIEIQFRSCKDACVIKADPGQIDQVLMNLCVNARDAMPDGGSIVIETEKVSVDSDFISMYPWAREGDYIRLTVSDNGIGMDRETLSRVFDPFFTTKEKGKGTGLGLSTVYGIVKQHNGMIHVYSELGQGTSFKLYFPAEQLHGENISAAKIEFLSGGDETLLVAEDDEDLLELTSIILERSGYKVCRASDGLETLDVVSDRERKIDLAIIDIVMPKISGLELLEKIRSLRPHLKVLFISGYSSGHINPGRELPLLTKPYSGQKLLKTVRELLDRE